MSWDARFLALAQHIAGWSKDPSTKVGAVVVDDHRRLVGAGYNGLPRGVTDHPDLPRDEKLRRTIHAEANALLFSAKTEGCTLYVTHPPCSSCAATAIQAGITRIVAITPAPEFAERWAESCKSTEAMLAEAGITYELRGIP
jgi:dCMP deaminase